MINLLNKSILTGNINEMVIPLDYETYNQCLQKWKEGALIQHAFPMLDFNEREFIKTGITPDEWNKYVTVGDDEE